MRKSLIDALFSKTRRSVLGAVLLQPEKWWYLSDLAKYLHTTPSSLQRELASFVEGDLLESRKDGNRVYYRVNKSCPVIQELQSLFIKTTGIADVIKSALKRKNADIDYLFMDQLPEEKKFPQAMLML